MYIAEHPEEFHHKSGFSGHHENTSGYYKDLHHTSSNTNMHANQNVLKSTNTSNISG